ncbi:MAG: crosslink repair DNA glycosylase YcaQ family protein [Actinomycetota bacterium]|nr:crosslink repair DNA glycosylase YcaQ family protein [Actinomycetota bacterium]
MAKTRTLTNDQARRIALGAQGFGIPRPIGRVDVRHFRRVMDRVGLLQLDSVNVLERSHYLPMFSRLGPYDRAAFDRWTISSGELFEYWGHEASLIPVERHPAFRFRMSGMKPWGSVRRLLDEQPAYIEDVLDQVAARGPLTVADLEDPGERGGPWWGYAPGKHALEWLFASGRITAFRSPSFGRRYDLPDRVVPASILDRPSLDRTEAYRTLLVDAARHHGIGTVADLADYHRLHRPTARPILEDLAAEGSVIAVAVDGWRHPAYLHPSVATPRRAVGTALLSPFDSFVWNRDRVERLFGFRYRIEIYVPKEQRQYGYYVLPFLLDGELVARVDLKADRKGRRLLVQSSHLEPGQEASRVAPPLAIEIQTMASWLELDDVVAVDRGDLAPPLAAAIT